MHVHHGEAPPEPARRSLGSMEALEGHGFAEHALLTVKPPTVTAPRRGGDGGLRAGEAADPYQTFLFPPPKRLASPRVQPDMITLFIMGLAGAGVLFAGLPVIVFGLMLETCAERADGNQPQEMPTVRRPPLPVGLRIAA